VDRRKRELPLLLASVSRNNREGERARVARRCWLERVRMQVWIGVGCSLVADQDRIEGEKDMSLERCKLSMAGYPIEPNENI
jgi:hypothetical protein